MKTEADNNPIFSVAPVKPIEMTFDNFTAKIIREPAGELSVQLSPVESSQLRKLYRGVQKHLLYAEMIQDFGLNSIYSRVNFSQPITIERLVLLDNQMSSGIIK